ncbi:DNA-3-methyladenine glycosylase family protein [Halomarina halobia]|uniref:DNA-3-methyladenine glycosylase family protein n=1 Tax=Halomarina halobia TaxID=3033386 RepID=A0ABD6A3X7_9EURY|nr:DNA-3-methyladenine glycosylase 2 family protein [Halomarina sp. PSR21]
MADLVDRHGPIDTSPADDEFERLCVSIINQQLSTASAAAVRDRVFALLGDVTPETVLAADREALREAGLSRTKVDYVRNAAEAFVERDLTREGLADHTDDEVIEELTRIKGVGEWTARMYLMFVLGRDDVLPLGDLGIRNGIRQIYGNGEEMTREEMRAIAERWRPYRSHAMRYVWAEYESDG